VTDSIIGRCSNDGTAGNGNNVNDHTGSIIESTQQKHQLFVLGRRLIYSHHIISKTKRANMKQLASQYQLTGYVKIGWPGIIVLEGAEEHCQEFYEEIKSWAWKYLVVRGEQQETVSKNNGRTLDSCRKFLSFQETSDMKVVAEHCKQVGLESLFRTSMKIYDNAQDAAATDTNESTSTNTNTNTSASTSSLYGILVWVDHMNDGKGYRKWLRKTALQTDVSVLVKQCHPHHDFTKRPVIFVVIVGPSTDVSSFMKRWRTSRVDVDSKGKPCLERCMTILHEGIIEGFNVDSLHWDKTSGTEDNNLHVNEEQLLELIGTFRNEEWNKAARRLLGVNEGANERRKE